MTKGVTISRATSVCTRFCEFCITLDASAAGIEVLTVRGLRGTVRLFLMMTIVFAICFGALAFALLVLFLPLEL